MRNTTKLRRLLERDEVLLLPGAYDALGAIIMKLAGFEAIYMSGNTTAASMLGKPDIGLITATEVIWRAERMAAAVDIPLVCDADTGYGNLHNVMQTVRDFEAAGVAGIHLEDQIHPHKCGSMAGVEIEPFTEAMIRIEAAIKARRDPDFVLIARTDARVARDFEEAIKRSKAFAEVGADLVFIVGLRSQEEIKEAAERLRGIPQLHIITEWRPWSNLPLSEMKRLGFKVAMYPMSLTLMIGKTMKDCANHLKMNGNTQGLLSKMMNFQNEYHEQTLGLSDYDKIEKEISNKYQRRND